MDSQPLTPGQEAVGLSFNPSGDERVTKAKQLSAELFDLVEGAVPSQIQDSSAFNWRRRKMRDIALGAILTAQMWAVKVLTLEDKK